MNDYVHEYYKKIRAREITVGKHIRKLYEKIIFGLEEKEFELDRKKCNIAIKFIENYCRQSKGSSDLLKLSLWQKALISLVFGIVDKDKKRIFTEVFIVVGRKNGKSTLAAAIIAYSCFIEREYGGEIYITATKKAQAEIVFDAFRQMVIADTELSSLCEKKRGKIGTKTIISILETGTIVKPLPATPESLDGLNPSLVINDEVAAWSGENGIKQYEVLKSAFGSRSQPLIINITTAGYETSGIYDELYKRGTAFLNGDTRERRLLPVIYQIDDELLWNDLNELEKANPNIRVSVNEQYFIDEAAASEQSAHKLAEFKVKYCNIKQNPVSSWLPFSAIQQADCDKTLEDFRDSYAVGGFDLSFTTDLSAATICIQKNNICYLFTRFFMPEEKFKKERHLYNVNQALIDAGILKLSGQNLINTDDVYEFFVEVSEKYNIYIQKIGYDRWNSKELVNKLNSDGFSTYDVWQGFNLHPIIVDFEGKIKDSLIKICSNPLLQLHFRNCALYEQLRSNGKLQIVKINQSSRIDGAMSSLFCFKVREVFENELGELLKNEHT